MQTGIILDHPAFLPGEDLPDQLQDPAPFSAIAQAHAVDVLFKIPPADEGGQGILLKSRDRIGIKGQFPEKAVGKELGQDHIADPDGGGQGFGKGIHIDHFAAGVDTLQGRDRFSVQPEFTVIIILNNITAFLFPGPGQQLISAADGHGDPGREMVGGADMGYIRSAGRQPAGIQAFPVHLDITAVCPAAPVDGIQFLIPRVLDGIDPVRSQKLDQHRVQIFRSGTDDDLVRIDGHPAEGGKVGRDGLTQLPDPLTGRHGQQVLLPSGNGLPHQLSPDRKREIRALCPVRGKVEYGFAALPPFVNVEIPAAGLRRKGQLRDIRNKIAFPGKGVHISLTDQLLIGVLNGNGTDAQIGGQGPFRRHFLIDPQPALQDVIPDAFIQMLIQRSSCHIHVISQHNGPLSETDYTLGAGIFP